jgi:hypothetical protein
MEVPERRVTGAMPAKAARCPEVRKLLPSPMARSMVAAVLMPTPGMDIKTLERGKSATLLGEKAGPWSTLTTP